MEAPTGFAEAPQSALERADVPYDFRASLRATSTARRPQAGSQHCRRAPPARSHALEVLGSYSPPSPSSGRPSRPRRPRGSCQPYPTAGSSRSDTTESSKSLTRHRVETDCSSSRPCWPLVAGEEQVLPEIASVRSLKLLYRLAPVTNPGSLRQLLSRPRSSTPRPFSSWVPSSTSWSTRCARCPRRWRSTAS